MEAQTGIGAGSIETIASWLATNIGARVVAFATDMTRAELLSIAHGDGAEDDADTRLRSLYAICSYMAIADGPGTAHDFLLEPNAALEFRTPAEVLHEGGSAERVWMAAVPVF
jgi:hypothetical protein